MKAPPIKICTNLKPILSVRAMGNLLAISIIKLITNPKHPNQKATFIYNSIFVSFIYSLLVVDGINISLSFTLSQLDFGLFLILFI